MGKLFLFTISVILLGGLQEGSHGDEEAYIKASPTVLGTDGNHSDWVLVEYSSRHPSDNDWIGVFSPANFNASICLEETENVNPPLLCSAPIKFQYANYGNPDYTSTGNASLKLQLINQRADFSFGLFSGGLWPSPKLVAVSNRVVFQNPKAPVYPRLALGKEWNEMTVTWTSGYGMDFADPVVEWGIVGGERKRSPAWTLTFGRNTMCGDPARTVGWRDPGYIHTAFLKELWPNSKFTYRVGHQLFSTGALIWSKEYQFYSPPFPGQDSLQQVVIFGDMGTAEADGSIKYKDYQPASLNTTKQLIRLLKGTNAVIFHIGDISNARGYLAQWDQFTAQIEPIASTVPYMIASGNHDRDWPNSGSFYQGQDSGGECGVVAQTMFYVPAQNRAKFWYASDYGMFRFCVANTELDLREGTEQYNFIEQCFATVDRQKQPWLIFLAHRVLGYSSANPYAADGTFGDALGRNSLQKLWQKYKVDIAVYGHVHHYERTCPAYQSTCMRSEKTTYTGSLNGTIHVVAGGGGNNLDYFSPYQPTWSLITDRDNGFVSITAFNGSYLRFEYMRSSDGIVHDSFEISRDYRDILSCSFDSCPATKLW